MHYQLMNMTSVQWRNFGLKSDEPSSRGVLIKRGSVPHSKKWGFKHPVPLKLLLCFGLTL